MQATVQKLKTRLLGSGTAKVHLVDVFRGATVAFLFKGLGVALAFFLNVLIARTFGAKDSGIFFLALTLSTVAAVFGRVGLDNAVLRFTASNAAIGNWGAIAGLHRKGISLALAASIFVGSACWILAPWLAVSVFKKPELAVPLRWMALSVPAQTIFLLYGEFLKGMRAIALSQCVQSVLHYLLVVAGFLLFGRFLDLESAAILYLGATVVAAVAGYYFWKLKFLAPPTQRVSFPFHDLFQSSLPLMIVAVMNLLINWSATLMLGVWHTAEDVGIFNCASRTAKLTIFVLIAVNSIAAPKFAGLFRKNDTAGLEETARKATLLMMIVSTPVFFIFLCLPGYVMGTFGKEFASGSSILTIIAIGQFINVATGSADYLLIMSGNERLLRNNVVFFGFINLTLCFLFIPQFGNTGAAIATALTLGFMNLVSTYLVWSRLGILTIPLPKRFLPNYRKGNDI
jgi:O-antigen/teichoic acid export membrane protein